MAPIAAVLSCVFFLAPALGQDDPFETHAYNLEYLTRSVEDWPGMELGLAAPGTAQIDETGGAYSFLTGEDLVHLIRANVAEDSWEHSGAGVGIQNGILVAVNRRSVQEKIGRYLAYWRGLLTRRVTLDAAIVSIDPPLLAKIRAGGNADRPLVLASGQVQQILDAARDGKQAELVKSMRATAHPGQRVSLQEAVQIPYISDCDVRISSCMSALIPVLGHYAAGSVLDVRPFIEPFGNAVTMEIRAEVAESEGLEERKLNIQKEIRSGIPDLGSDPKTKKTAPLPGGVHTSFTDARVHLAKVAADRVRTTLTVRDRETAVVGFTLRNNRCLVVLVTPSIVSIEDKAPVEPVLDEQRLTRVYDISPLTRGISDFPGPQFSLPTSSRMNGGPLTGATFCMDEPRVAMRFTSAQVAQLVRTRMAPDTWANKRNSIVEALNTLVVRQKPDALKEIDAYLKTLLSQRAQMITLDAVLLSFRKGAREVWEKEIPGLAAGGYFVEPDKLEKLLEEARKGPGIRVLDAAEVSGYPQQRVHAARLQEESYLAGSESHMGTFVAAWDPIVPVLLTGFVFDVHPHYVSGTDQIAVDLKASYALREFKENEEAAAGAGPFQSVRFNAMRWNGTLICVRGRYTVAGVETRGKGDDREELMLLVRARANILK